MTDFGKDISCTTELRTGRYVTGARLVAEAIYRRLTTPRGMLRGGEDEADYGLDLTELVGSATTKADAAALEGRIRAEVAKDERVDTISVVVIPNRAGPAVSFDITVSGHTADGGTFELKVAVDQVTVALLGITADSK